ncbi:MAG: hypothetical protein HGA75_00995 [Thiobacillus sp.]|nr:hypothetical protein [Thiobacillus sp.]
MVQVGHGVCQGDESPGHCPEALNLGHGGCLTPGLPLMLASLSRVKSRDGLAAWCRNELSKRMTFRAFLCRLSHVDGQAIAPMEAVSIGMEAALSAACLGQLAGFHQHILRHWLHVEQPLLATADTLEQVIADPVARQRFQACGLGNIAAFGMRGARPAEVSHFCFFGIPEASCARWGLFLELLAAPLHAALVRIATRSHPDWIRDAAMPKLTPREREILKWIGMGKTNCEIAMILGTRYKTVKNQVQNLLAKLDVNNRAHAVAKAAALGLY